MTKKYIDIEYRDFYDKPRSILIRLPAAIVWLDCAFSEDEDDYEDHYRVYRLPATTRVSTDWNELHAEVLESLGSISVSDVKLDASLRKQLDLSCLLSILPADLYLSEEPR